MGGLIEPTPVNQEPDSSRLTIAIAVAVVIVVAVVAALLLRSQPKGASGPPPYAANLRLSDFKMSAAENFVGHTVSYVDGTITNAGDKTVTHVVAQVTFKDDMGQIAQREEVPMKRSISTFLLLLPARASHFVSRSKRSQRSGTGSIRTFRLRMLR
jgi:hypothetical protein